MQWSWIGLIFSLFLCGDSMEQNDQATPWMHVIEPKLGGFLRGWAQTEACGVVNVWHALVHKAKAKHKPVACETEPTKLKNQTSPTPNLAINIEFHVATKPH
jgi:hypothetical protein